MAYVGNQPYQVAFVTDTFSGNGSTVAFTMSVAPANTASVLVVVSGVVQDPSTYSVSGTTLTFTGAPPSGTGNISCRYLGIPASGVTTTAYRTVTEFTATAGQTTFTPPSYTVGFISVYRNGALLGSADYTASNGTTVVLATGASLNDLVTVESFLVSSVLNAIPAVAGAVGSTYLASSLSLTTPTLSSPTLSSPTISGTPVVNGSLIVLGTTTASTSGTSITFTGIPSWAKCIKVMLSAVAVSSSSILQIQLGTSGGFQTTGYNGIYVGGSNGSTLTTSLLSTGIPAGMEQLASTAQYGMTTIALLDSATGTWAYSGTSGSPPQGVGYFATGTKVLSGTLTQVRVTTTGTDTFNAGSINIQYE